MDSVGDMPLRILILNNKDQKSPSHIYIIYDVIFMPCIIKTGYIIYNITILLEDQSNQLHIFIAHGRDDTTAPNSAFCHFGRSIILK